MAKLISLETLKAESSPGTPYWIARLPNNTIFLEADYNILKANGIDYISVKRSTIKYYNSNKEQV